MSSDRAAAVDCPRENGSAYLLPISHRTHQPVATKQQGDNQIGGVLIFLIGREVPGGRRSEPGTQYLQQPHPPLMYVQYTIPRLIARKLLAQSKPTAYLPTCGAPTGSTACPIARFQSCTACVYLLVLPEANTMGTFPRKVATSRASGKVDRGHPTHPRQGWYSEGMEVSYLLFPNQPTAMHIIILCAPTDARFTQQ